MTKMLQIKLREGKADWFKEIHEELPTETYVETVLKLLSFYEANSPYLKQTKEDI